MGKTINFKEYDTRQKRKQFLLKHPKYLLLELLYNDEFIPFGPKNATKEKLVETNLNLLWDLIQEYYSYI